MATKRKKWATSLSGIKQPQQSKKAAYEQVQRYAALWQEGSLRSPHMTVYVDEGNGWSTYERIDLGDVEVQT